MRKLLVTGGAGFIGVNFVYHWLATRPDDQVVVLDKLTYAGCKESLTAALKNDHCHFYQGDIGDSALTLQLLREQSIDTVVNFAAESHVDRSITGPEAFTQTNVVGTHRLLEVCRQYWLDENKGKDHRFHHVSTDEVYGSLGPNDPAFTEQTPYQPNSPYSASKAASDHLVRAYHHTYGMNVTTSNCSNNYGPFHFPEKLIPLCITNILCGKPIPVYGDGKNIRDWLFVKDHCEGIGLVVESGRSGETYNIGGNNEWDNLSLVKEICRIMDEKAASGVIDRALFPNSVTHRKSAFDAIEFVTDRPGHDRRYAVNASKIEAELGFRAQTPLHQGLEDTIDWYLKKQDWWRPLLGRADF